MTYRVTRRLLCTRRRATSTRLSMSPPRLTSPSLSLNSSPSSSPPLGPCDSSPASSPVSRALSLSPPASPGVADPFAASTKGVRQPRIYEKRDSYGSSYNGTDDSDVLGVSSSRLQPRVPSWSTQDQSDQRVRTASTASNSSTDTWLTPARRASASGSAFVDPELDIDLSDEEEDEKKLPTVWKSRAERERALWDGAIELAYQKLDGIVDLQCVYSFVALHATNFGLFQTGGAYWRTWSHQYSAIHRRTQQPCYTTFHSYADTFTPQGASANISTRAHILPFPHGPRCTS